jgi:phosphoglycerol transferase MdoB-like AlkP superfamily enzyme
MWTVVFWLGILAVIVLAAARGQKWWRTFMESAWAWPVLGLVGLLWLAVAVDFALTL